MLKTLILEPLKSTAAPKRWLIPGQRLTVGRSAYADHEVPSDGHMSAVHFSLECTATRGVIRDLGSSNGTFVNGAKVVAAYLRDGDCVSAGTTSFTVRLLLRDPGGAARSNELAYG